MVVSDDPNPTGASISNDPSAWYPSILTIPPSAPDFSNYNWEYANPDTLHGLGEVHTVDGNEPFQGIGAQFAPEILFHDVQVIRTKSTEYRENTQCPFPGRGKLVKGVKRHIDKLKLQGFFGPGNGDEYFLYKDKKEYDDEHGFNVENEDPDFRRGASPAENPLLGFYDGGRRLWKDEMILDREFEVRIRSRGDGTNSNSYVTDLDIANVERDRMKRASNHVMGQSATFLPENDVNETDAHESMIYRAALYNPVTAAVESDNKNNITSDPSILPEREKRIFVAEFAEHLSRNMQHHKPDEQMLQRCTEILLGLIRGFVLQAERNSTDEAELRIADLMKHNARDIVNATFEKLWPNQSFESARTAEMNLNNIINLGVSKDDMTCEEVVSPETSTHKDKCDDTGNGVIETGEDPEEMNDRINGRETKTVDLNSYRDSLASNPAFQSLLANVKRECLLASQQPNSTGMTKRSILDFLNQSLNPSRHRSAEGCNVTFMIEWDPKIFIRSQRYSERPEHAIEKAITVTGSITNAQALTCRQYLCQTWPSTGLGILLLVKDIVRSEGNFQRSYTLSNKANVAVSYLPSKMLTSSTFTINVIGTAQDIAEIGEQLAWLGAALQSPKFDGISSIKPQIHFLAANSIRIGFIETESRVSSTLNGNCWHNLFRSPVVVDGFPIPRRSQASLIHGLEIPLNMMAGLAQARRVSKFCSRTILKGYSAMLLPVGQIGDVVMWHLVHDKEGNRISYNDSAGIHTVDIDLSTLENSRHVLGWCSEMKFYGGAEDARYNIGPSRLRRAQRTDGIFAEAALHHGQIISGGHPFSVGHRDIQVHVSQDGFIPRLKWMSKKYVVLWDTACNRAWLINGTAALLHLVRASLERDKTDPFNSVFLFDGTEMTEAPQSHHPHSAIHVLINQKNLNMKVYPNKDSYITFEHRVEHFYDVLEKLIDNQLHVVGKYGDRDMSREHLVGWDFIDLISSRDPVYPRLAALDQMGKSWVDFSRSIHAIALFGNGFGEIIEPVGAFCPYWAKLPKDRSYMAVCVSDLKEIMDAYGDPSSIPTQLTHNTVWQHIEQPFRTCVCHSSQDGKHSDLTQVLLTPKVSCEDFLRSPQIVNLDNSGAVIFGFNKLFKWYWGDTGDPTSQIQELDEYHKGKSFVSSPTNDSGLGKSLSSSSLQDRDSRINTNSYQEADDLITSPPLDHQKQKDHIPPHASTNMYEHRYFAFNTYTVGIVCALPIEFSAVRTLFDQKHREPPISTDDPNQYALGRMANHKIVAACLPVGTYGNNSAVSVISNMIRTFRSLKFCLLVGIGAGVPSQQNDIRLGDVVVSKPTGTLPGVLQYDFGKALENGTFQEHGSLPPPPMYLMSAISKLESDPDLPAMPLDIFLQQILSVKDKFWYPGQENDKLYASDFVHVSNQKTCRKCNSEYESKRSPRTPIHPRIHYGLIASGNQVMKDAQLRDRLGQKHDILCFEMEAAGIINIFPCLVIRGICDYADSHKNKEWQGYAAASAAAYAKLLLSRVRPSCDLDFELQTVQINPYGKRQEEVQLSPRKRARAEDPESYTWKANLS